MQRGQTIGFVTSCLVTQEELGQQPKKRKENTQRVKGRINDVDTRIGNAEKAGWKADSVHSIENRQC